jgi:hypothetical protein
MMKKPFLFKDEDEVEEPVEQVVNVSEPGEKVHQVFIRETKIVSVSITGQQIVVKFRDVDTYSNKNN